MEQMTLLQGDCLELMKDIPDGGVDLLLTDIPYGVVNRKSNGLRNLETYMRAKADLKKKWLNNRGVRVRRIVDEALQRTKDELYETFNIKEDAT